MVNIDSFISTLENEIADKTIEIKLAKAPSYISCFLSLDEIILIHKSESKKIISKNTEEEISENDVTGHPLEVQLTTGNITVCLLDQFECFELFNEKGHVPLTLTEARRCLNIYNLSKSFPPYPVWVLVDGSDNQKTVLLSSFKYGGWARRSWALNRGVLEKPPTLERLQQIHARLTCVQNPTISCQFRCTYLIRSLTSEHDPMEFYSYTILQASWNTLRMNPPLNRSTEVTLITKCMVGSGKGGLLIIWKHLLLIHQYVEIIIERTKNNCSDNNIILPSCLSYLKACEKSPSDENPLSRIRKILKEPMRGHRNISSKATLDDIINILTTGLPGMDITDKLWYIFIECKSYQELAACFKELLAELRKMGASSPFVSSGNISCLANSLVGHGGAHILDPLECVVEVGLDKLRKEIHFIFSKAQIATLNSLNVPQLPKFTEIPPSDWMQSVQTWLLWFSRIHCVLELLWNTQEAIIFPNDYLLTLTSIALNTFTGPNSKVKSFEWLMENVLQEIKTNVPISSVEGRLGNNPEQWILTLNTKLEGREIESVFYRGLQSPFTHVLGQGADQTKLPNITINTSIEEELNYSWAELYTVSDEMDTC